jgi:hypothetical protein
MSSVTRFIRQVPVSTTYYDAANIVNEAATASANAYAFLPRADNYVGNYPPGVMQLASTGLNSLSLALNGEIVAAFATYSDNLILRDLGKTIYAEIGSTAAVSVGAGSFGYFREVQLIAPRPNTPLSAPSATLGGSLIGGVNGTTFGVIGSSSNYLTFYIPVTVAGVRAPANAANFNVIAGGQM